MKFFIRFRPAALAAGLFCLLLSASCTYTKGPEEAPTPNPVSCVTDPASVRYSVEISAIIQNNCVQCHGAKVAAQLGGGHNWENYDQLQEYAKSGSLVGVVEQKDPKYAALYMPRPIGSAKLSACDIDRIKAWVSKESPNN